LERKRMKRKHIRKNGPQVHYKRGRENNKSKDPLARNKR
jgi:hypothetical protein